MTVPNRNKRPTKTGAAEIYDMVLRAFAEFLMFPSYIIFAFLFLAVGTYLLDRGHIAWLEPVRTFLETHVFANAQSTSALLGTIAGGLFTITSITISLLLLALQQAAASMTHQVLDQFLRRRINQLYFGFFIGLSLYALITLATASERFNPVFGATLAFLMTIVALYLLLLLLYSTINQMRPIEIIESIHNYILGARERQLTLLRQTRRASLLEGARCLPVKVEGRGFVTHIRLEVMAEALKEARGETEVVLFVSTGAYVAFGDVIAEVRTKAAEAEAIEEAVRSAVHLERQRDLMLDPAYGIEELEMIAWTSISTSKSNPAPGLETIRSLRDLLARWSAGEQDAPETEPLPVVYTDNVMAKLMSTFETLAIASSESMQHQNFIEVLRTFVVLFDRLSEMQRERAEDVILRILSALGDHVLTAELDAELKLLADTLADHGSPDTARKVYRAREALAQSVGKLNSRSTRATAGN